jgi:uncharacterized protein (TIGR03067 family)
MKHLLLIVVAGLLVGADDTKKDDAIKEELKKLEGTWVVESATRNGKDDRKGGPSECTFSGGMLSMKEEDGTERKGKITIDPTKNPKTLDFEPEQKKGNEGTGRAIYELKGDTLKICISPPGTERPTEFSDKDQILVTLKRKKP